MNKPILELQGVKTIVNKGTSSETTILKGLNLKINEGDIITIVGTNGAGKSTLFNVIGGNLHADEGKILHNGQDITNTTEEQRTAFLSRVFQDPKLGTAARMTVAENMLLATKRGERRHLIPRKLKSNMDRFTKLATTMKNGLENRMNTATGALDPHTSLNLLHATNERITKDHLTALMITHNLEDALEYGNRLIVLKDGEIKADFNAEQRKSLTPEKLYTYFEG